MEKFGDSGFVYHRAMAQIMALIAAQVADLPLVSFRAKDYAEALGSYVKKVEDKLDEAICPSGAMKASSMSDEAIIELRASPRKTSDISYDVHDNQAPSRGALDFKEALGKLHKAVLKLKVASLELDERAKELESRIHQHIPWWKWPKWIALGWEIRKLNTQYKYLERDFLYAEGLDSRPWFKHVVFAPGLWTGYAGGESFVHSSTPKFNWRVWRVRTNCIIYKSCVPRFGREHRHGRLDKREKMGRHHRGAYSYCGEEPTGLSGSC